MTPATIDTLSPGSTLDLAVAAVIGPPAFTIGDRCYRHYATSAVHTASHTPSRPLNTKDTPFHPSTEWNDAMWATAHFRLPHCDAAHSLTIFDIYNLRRIESANSAPLWAVVQIDPMAGNEPALTSDASGPVAICRAILKLHHLHHEVDGL